jgi:large subunit ribosomal protein L18
MAMRVSNRKQARAARHRRIRRKVSGTAERPRMAVAMSGKYMYVQFIDDDCGQTLASASTLNRGEKSNVATAAELGRRAAEAAKEKGISQVIVDRGGFSFHGRVKAIVDSAIEAGLVTSSKEEL